jgi:manganese/zinc/iron transport system permease protein
MTGVELEIQLLAVTVAVSCALPGVFLVLRRMALMSDAISHTVLLGIVLAFFVVKDLTSPLLIVGAAATGVLTVALVEALQRTGLVKEDAAIGLVFPALFSIAVILITRFAADVHLDTDAVLLGEIALAPFRRVEVAGHDLGPRALWVMLGILLLNAAFLAAFYKELKLSTFDPALAAALGFSPALLHYAFMGVVSVTAVGAFDSVGSILVVAFMIVPPASAYLLSDRLGRVIGLSAGIGAALGRGRLLARALARCLHRRVRWRVQRASSSCWSCCWRRGGGSWPWPAGARGSASSSPARCSPSTCSTTRGRRPQPRRAGSTTCRSTCAGPRTRRSGSSTRPGGPAT